MRLLLSLSRAVRRRPTTSRPTTSWIVLPTIALALVHPGQADSRYSIGPVPRWVSSPPASEADSKPVTDQAGVAHLLVDEQVRVAGRATEHFYHMIRRVESTAGVEDSAQLRFDFDPSYQRLVIHYVRVRRDHRSIDCLRQSEIKVIQQEDDLGQQLYNGTLSALVILSDVRVGDELDFAYSVVGDNPILNDKFVDDCYLGWQEPVSLTRYRLLWPADRTLHWRRHKTDIEPQVRRLGPTIEYVWQSQNTQAVDPEDSSPAWYSPSPMVQLSEFGTWREVADWALPMYRPSSRQGSALQRQIETWRTQWPRPEDRIEGTLRFVQDEVRYLGIEMGRHSHLPHNPEQVFSRRYGDCKDKSLLLVTILTALGVEADAALVSTDEGPTLDEAQPSPFVFDHVIVKISTGGKSYWFDPTASLQRGMLAQHYNPPFARALLIRSGTTDLERIPLSPQALPTTTVKEIFRVHSGAGGTDLEVETTYRGVDADIARQELTDDPKAKIRKTNLAYYAEFDHSIILNQEGSPDVTDDRVSNMVTVRERYRLPAFPSDISRTLTDSRLVQLLKAPPTSVREAPLAIPFPVNVSHSVEIHLPHAVGSAHESGTIEDDGLRFDYRREAKGDRVSLEYRLRTLADNVPASKAARYLDDVRRISQNTRYELPIYAEGRSDLMGVLRFGPVAMILPVLAVWLILHRRRQRRRLAEAAAAPLS
jgi:transglutaminase-like putative cysteine protease